MTLRLVWLFSALMGTVVGHGTMLEPTPRQPESTYWYQVGCMIGCKCSGDGKETYPTPSSVGCSKPANPTLLASERTWNVKAASPEGDWNKYMPWRAPGTAVPIDACGIASGFSTSAKVQYPHTFAESSNVKQGDKGSELPLGKITEWEAGATVTASWTLIVNHGGGYQYRVCPTGTNMKVDNACFDSNPLKFAGKEQTVHFQSKGSKPVTLSAVDVSKGVKPEGSAWRRLPIPACACDLGSGCGKNYSKSSGKDNKTVSDFVPYGQSASAPSHGSCTTGLQFSASHLAKDWPEGYGYYVSQLGKAEGDAKGCAGITSEEACGKLDGCTWYGPKSTCYAPSSKTKRRILDEKLNNDKCLTYKSKETCGTVDGCAWYASKNVCYSDGADAKDFSGNEAVVYGDAKWWITDSLVAPTEIGSYVLQWRWDNEQTPQVWTTCADIKVVESSASKILDNCKFALLISFIMSMIMMV